jgi:hypothetical protein
MGERPADALQVNFGIPGLKEVEARLYSHPGYVKHMRIEAFGLSLGAVFATNRAVLVGMLQRAATDLDLRMQLIQNVARSDAARAFNAALINALHNYCAGVGTLADHSRPLTQDWTGELAEEMVARKEQLLSNPEVTFVKDLRNFMLHRSLPFLGHTLRLGDVNTDRPTNEMQIELSATELLRSDGWTRPSKDFLAGYEEKVALLPIIEKHGQVVVEFNQWVIGALAEANREALAEANAIVAERNALLGGIDIETARRVTDGHTRRLEEVAWPPSKDDLPFNAQPPTVTTLADDGHSTAS